MRALPLSDTTTEFINNHERVYVIENNFDGQLKQIMNIEHDDISYVKSLALGDGLPMTPKWIVDKIMEKEGN